MSLAAPSPKVLFIDSVHPVLQQRLEAMGYECVVPDGIQRAEILRVLPNYTGIVIRSKVKIDRELLDCATQLKWIARSGSGLENVDVPYAESKGIACINSPEGNRDAVGEHTVGMLLALFNKLLLADREVRDGQWRREANRGLELKGKTVGIIGYGNMGQATAQRLSGFACNVLAYDKYKSGFSSALATEASLEQLFAEADIVCLHVPLTDETRYMVDWPFLNRFAKPIYLSNLARGMVVNTADLVQAMQQELVLGACLDVLEYESHAYELMNENGQLPEPMQYLAQSDRVVLSPHVGGWTVESYIKLSTVLADKVEARFHS